MSLIGALSCSSLAMLAQSQGMQTVSNNIANVNTISYKREETLFATLLNGQKANGTKMFSAQAVDRRSVMAQGLIASTGRSDDLALDGEGFFIVSRTFGSTIDNDIYFTRDGALQQKYVDDGSGTQQSYYTTANGKYLMGWAANDDGTFSTSNSITGLVPLRAFSLDEISGVATTQALMAANIPSNTEIGKSVSLQGSVHDQAFNSQTLSYLWTKTAANNWTIDFGVSGGTVTAPAAGTSAVSFTGDGKLLTPQDPVEVAVTWDDGTTSTIAVDLTEMEQYADATTIYRTWQDGSESGRLYDESFDKNGVLWVSYTNGRNRALYKVAVAEFVAPDSLEAVSGNLFRATEAAGEVAVRDLELEQQGTTILVGNLESSNVDLADEFTRMMMVQKAYTMASTTPHGGRDDRRRGVDEALEHIPPQEKAGGVPAFLRHSFLGVSCRRQGLAQGSRHRCGRGTGRRRRRSWVCRIAQFFRQRQVAVDGLSHRLGGGVRLQARDVQLISAAIARAAASSRRPWPPSARRGSRHNVPAPAKPGPDGIPRRCPPSTGRSFRTMRRRECLQGGADLGQGGRQ